MFMSGDITEAMEHTFRLIIAPILMTEPIIIGATEEIRIRIREKEEQELIKKLLQKIFRGLPKSAGSFIFFSTRLHEIFLKDQL